MGRGQGSQVAASQRGPERAKSASSPGRASNDKKSKASAKGKEKARDDESADDSATEGSETEVSGDEEAVRGGSNSRSGSESVRQASDKGKRTQRPLGIISKETPLQDFEKNLAQEGMISTALEGSKSTMLSAERYVH